MDGCADLSGEVGQQPGLLGGEGVGPGAVRDEQASRRGALVGQGVLDDRALGGADAGQRVAGGVENGRVRELQRLRDRVDDHGELAAVVGGFQPPSELGHDAVGVGAFAEHQPVDPALDEGAGRGEGHGDGGRGGEPGPEVHPAH